MILDGLTHWIPMKIMKSPTKAPLGDKGGGKVHGNLLDVTDQEDSFSLADFLDPKWSKDHVLNPSKCPIIVPL